MKKRIVIFGGIIIVAISSIGGTEALSLLADQQWSNYVQSWKTPGVVARKEMKPRLAKNTSMTVCASPSGKKKVQ